MIMANNLPVSPASPAKGARSGSLGVVTAGLVLILAFLAASFPARNSDHWFHLATGRLMARGELAFGADPFAYTSQGYWTNHSWLFDLGLFALDRAAGGAALVALKALVVAILAGVMLRIRRAGAAGWVPALFTALAVLAMSPRLLLQPACLSYFFLGLTLWLLWRPHCIDTQPVPESKRSPASSLALLAAFSLWVNLDEWFLLGPLTVALFWLGERASGPRRTPGWLIPASLAACLLSPHTFHVFTLPTELSPVTWSGGLRLDPRLRPIFASPWERGFLVATIAPNAAHLSFFILLAAGIASFVIHPRALWSWRAFVCLPFALLAVWQIRMIPFFAVVAAPIAALNWQDYLAQRRLGVDAERPARGRRAARLLALVRPSLLLVSLLLGLIALAWPGWLGGISREDRHVGWGTRPDPSLRRVAETLQRWRQEGLLHPGERVFALSQDVGAYLAWFCPGEQSFFDHRYKLFTGVAGDYERVCRGIENLPGPQADDLDWHDVLNRYGVGLVVVHEREPARMYGGLRRLGGDPEHWTLLDVSGQAAIFGRNAARARGAFGPLAFDEDRLAFSSHDDRAHRLSPAPETGVGTLPSRRTLWAQFSRAPAATTWESQAASVYLHYADDLESSQQFRRALVALRLSGAVLGGLPSLPPLVPQAAWEALAAKDVLAARDDPASRQRLEGLAVPGERSPALPLLAVRAGRRAVAEDPQDSNAWLRLGQAYLFLRDRTGESAGTNALPPLLQLRHIQIVAALEQALRLDPELEAAHHELAFVYGERNQLDIALEHRREEVRLSRRAGPRPGETAQDAAYRLELLDQDTAKLEEIVRVLKERFAAGSRALEGDRVQQANAALRLGLTRQAVDDILALTPPSILGAAGIKLQLEVMLSIGRVEEVRTILNDEAVSANRGQFPFHNIPSPVNPDGTPLYPGPYHWPGYESLQFLQSAAVGDYAQARSGLQTIRAGFRFGLDRLRQKHQALIRADIEILPWLLSAPRPILPAFGTLAYQQLAEERHSLEIGDSFLRAQQADLLVLQGLLDLEQGQPGDARAALTEAGRVAGTAPFAGRSLGERYLRRLMH
jgi:tetratricopeptide (TPR) repeat protein